MFEKFDRQYYLNTIIKIKLTYFLLTFILTTNAYGAEKNDLKRLNDITGAQQKNEMFELPNHDFRSTNLDMDNLLSFKGSNFEKANFSGTFQKPKIITNIDFTGCNLNKTDFSFTIITRCKFNNAQAYRANFNGAVIKFTSFNNVFAHQSNFSNTNQESVGFDNANLQCSLWNEANIFRLSFTRSDERGIIKKNLKEKDCSHEDAVQLKFLETFKCPPNQ